jgi:glycosyltransferase involved in cell wall biosynthesis
MPVYNCENFVRDALMSILDQSYSDFELIIIDDASTDKTVSIINEIKDTRIELIEKLENTGYTNSLNFGLSIAKGKYIARMDGDDISHPERFTKQVDFLESHLDVIVCGTNYSFIGRKTNKVLPENHEDIKIELLKNTCFGHPTVMIRKEILDKHDLKYDIEKEPAEDYALWITLLNYGKFHNIQEDLLLYRVHDGQVSRERREIQLYSKLSSRVKILEYLGIDLTGSDQEVLKRAISDDELEFKDLLSFINIKEDLIKANVLNEFFKLDDFESYLNGVERSIVMRYFLKRKRYSPGVYKQYLKIKRQLNYKLPFKSDIIIMIKSLLYYNVKQVTNELR